MNYYDLARLYLNEQIDLNFYFNDVYSRNNFITNYVYPYIHSISIKDLLSRINSGEFRITETLLSMIPKTYKKYPSLMALACSVNYQFIKFWEGGNTDAFKK